MKKVGYHLGGGEYCDEMNTHTIVDYLPPQKIAEYNGCRTTDFDYVWADLRCDGWWEKMPKRQDVYCGAVVRYIGSDPHGQSEPRPGDGDVYERFARGLSAITRKGGTVRWRESPALIREVMKHLPEFVNQDNPNLDQKDVEDPDSDCIVTFKRK